MASLSPGAWIEARGLTFCTLVITHFVCCGHPSGDIVQPPRPMALPSVETILGEREQLWVISSQHWQQLGGGSTSPVKGVWAGHQECSLLTQNERMMIHWLVKIINIAQPVHFTGEASDVQREELKSISLHPLRALPRQFDQILTSSHLPASEHGWHVQPAFALFPNDSGISPAATLLLMFLLWQVVEYLSFFSTSNYSPIS